MAYDALGDGVPDHAVGQRVVALTHFGGHADVVCVPAGQVFQIPDEMSFEEAAALPVNYLTAYHMLFRVAEFPWKRGHFDLADLACPCFSVAAIFRRSAVGVQIGTTWTPTVVRG